MKKSAALSRSTRPFQLRQEKDTVTRASASNARRDEPARFFHPPAALTTHRDRASRTRRCTTSQQVRGRARARPPRSWRPAYPKIQHDRSSFLWDPDAPAPPVSRGWSLNTDVAAHRARLFDRILEVKPRRATRRTSPQSSAHVLHHKPQPAHVWAQLPRPGFTVVSMTGVVVFDARGELENLGSAFPIPLPRRRHRPLHHTPDNTH